MSDYESYTGKIKKVIPIMGETFEERCERLYHTKGGKREYYEGILFDDFYDDFIKVGEELYEVIEKIEIDPYDYYCNLVEHEDGTISFSTRYYNGGTCLSEMVEDELNKLNQK